MRVIDKFLPTELFLQIQEVFQSPEFPWYWSESKVVNSMECGEENNYQFVHTFYEDNDRLSNWNINPIIEALNVNALVRIKANLSPRTDKIVKFGFHTDNSINCNTAIYYLNSNNGFTEFENGTIVESVENRMIIFNSNIHHTGTTCTDCKRRIVLNLNYF